MMKHRHHRMAATFGFAWHMRKARHITWAMTDVSKWMKTANELIGQIAQQSGYRHWEIQTPLETIIQTTLETR